MKKLAQTFVIVFCFSIVGLTGCGESGDTTVIQAPAAEEPDAISQAVSEDEYSKAMAESMKDQGN